MTKTVQVTRQAKPQAPVESHDHEKAKQLLEAENLRLRKELETAQAKIKRSEELEKELWATKKELSVFRQQSPMTKPALKTQPGSRVQSAKKVAPAQTATRQAIPVYNKVLDTKTPVRKVQVVPKDSVKSAQASNANSKAAQEEAKKMNEHLINQMETELDKQEKNLESLQKERAEIVAQEA